MAETTLPPLAWHEQTEWESDLAYAAGFDDGIAAASQAMETALAEALAPPTAYGVTKVPDGAQDVVGRMLRSMQRQALSRRLEPLRGPDWPGGEVPLWAEPEKTETTS